MQVIIVDKTKKVDDHSDESPPVLGSWKKIYFFVLSFLVIEILLFFYFTRMFE
jgi:hypothetical protein